jgi:hypothetical protein
MLVLYANAVKDTFVAFDGIVGTSGIVPKKPTTVRDASRINPVICAPTMRKTLASSQKAEGSPIRCVDSVIPEFPNA